MMSFGFGLPADDIGLLAVGHHLNPSAGMIRIRFDGLAKNASQPGRAPR